MYVMCTPGKEHRVSDFSSTMNLAWFENSIPLPPVCTRLNQQVTLLDFTTNLFSPNPRPVSLSFCTQILIRGTHIFVSIKPEILESDKILLEFSSIHTFKTMKQIKQSMYYISLVIFMISTQFI